jgi:hypothetical protein
MLAQLGNQRVDDVPAVRATHHETVRLMLTLQLASIRSTSRQAGSRTVASSARSSCGVHGLRRHRRRTRAQPSRVAEGTFTAAAEYDALVADAGPVDVQLLGVGSTGHIGFNEPGSSLGSATRVKTLTEPSRRDNAWFFVTTGFSAVRSEPGRRARWRCFCWLEPRPLQG